MRRALVIGAVLAALAERSTARAQSPTPSRPIEVVVTGTRTPESTQRATVRTDVVTRAEAERRGATNVGEALQGQLGVQVNPGAYGYLGNPSAIQIQGFDLNRVLVLEDGERVIGDVGGAIDLSQIPLTDVRQVEVVAGPMSALYGASAIGGVVNVISAPPVHEGWSGRARLEGRSRPGVLFQGSGAYRRGETWASADGSFQWQEGIAAGAGTSDLAIPPTRSSLLGVRAGHRLGSRVSLLARARWIHDASTGRREQIVPGLGTYRIDLPERTDRIALRLSENIELGGGSSVRITVGRQWAFNEATQDRYQSPLDQTRRRSDVMSSFEVVTTVADGPRTWVAGARAEAERLEQRLTGMELVGGGLSTSDWNEVPGRTLGSGAVYAQLAYRVHPSLTIMPGARAEVHLRYGGVVVPRLSIAYLPGPAWTLRLSGGGGFRAPSAKEMGFSFDHSIYGYRVVGNPDLLPERSWGLSGDVAFRPTPAFTVRAGGFANWVTRLIDLVLVPDSMKAGVSDYTYQNLGAGRTSGAQVDMVYQVATWLRAEAGYAYLWTRDDTHERPLQGRPPHTIVASMRAELPFRVELFARWRGVTDAFIDERTRTPAYSTLDARIARPLWPSSLAYVGVQNALDIRRDPSLAGDQRPIAGRTFYVGLTAELPLEDTP